MPFCPNCKTEYQAGVKTCADCGAALVDALPKEEDLPFSPTDEGVFLAAANESADVLAIEGRLRSEGIPFRKKGFNGPGGFGAYAFGAEFYVPKRCLARAQLALPAGLPPCPKEPGTPEGEEPAFSEAAAPGAPETGEANGEKVDDALHDAESNVEGGKKGGVLKPLGFVLFLIAAALVVFGVDSLMNLFRSAMGWS